MTPILAHVAAVFFLTLLTIEKAKDKNRNVIWYWSLAMVFLGMGISQVLTMLTGGGR